MSDNISMHRLNLSITIVNIIIHQLSKFFFSCVSLVENLSCEIDEIKRSPASAGEGNNALGNLRFETRPHTKRHDR